MKNFKEIVDKCLVGRLSGTFVLRNGDTYISSKFKKDKSLLTSFICLEHFHYSDYGHCYSSIGHESKFDIIDFIPDNIQEQIKIDIPEGKVPVMEQTESGVVITWKEKKLTYDDIVTEFIHNSKFIYNYIRDSYVDSLSSQPFYKKVEVLRKLTNIRNYFGEPDGTRCGYYIYKSDRCGFQVASTGYPSIYANGVVVFKEKEHAEQAIKMLGDELKYLFEPW